MSHWRKVFLGNRGFGINMLACFCFVMLAVYGWGMSWAEVGYYLLLILTVFGVILAVAFLLGFLIRKIRK
jgi:hypothetical protein